MFSFPTDVRDTIASALAALTVSAVILAAAVLPAQTAAAGLHLCFARKGPSAMSRLVIDRRRGMWLGVCQGLADYTGFDAGLVRLGVVLFTVFGLGLPGLVIYLLIGWLGGER